MATDSKKHHYVPQAHLRRFSIGGAGKQVFVFDKLSGRSFPGAIQDAGSENHFNTFEGPDGLVNFESWFRDVDDRSAALFGRVTAERGLGALDAADRRDLADTVALQLLRTRLPRTTIQVVGEQLLGVLSDAGLAPDHAGHLTPPTENGARRAMLDALRDRAGFTAALVAKLPVLIEPRGVARFWISDHPVVRVNSAPYGDVGLSSPGVEVYLPLAPDLMLGLLCPSLELKLRAARVGDLEIDDAPRARLTAIHDGILTGRPVRQDDATVDRFNRLQVSNSARFLYADRDDFDAARDLLGTNPGLRRVTTQVRAGRLGEGPPRRARMPKGLWLVLYGSRNHHMLPIEARITDLEPVEASTPDHGTLAVALDDAPLIRAEIFESGQARWAMRAVSVEILAPGPPTRFRIVHSDPSLNQLMETIAAGRGTRSRR